MVYDAVVVGARCAGASTAMLLARDGLKVLVVERGRYGTDTLSTLAIMRGGVLQLSRWDVLDAVQAQDTPPIRSTSFHYGDEMVDVAIEPRDGIDALYAPRRTVLDAALADAAAAAGAEVRYGVRLVGLTKDAAGRVRGVVLEDATFGRYTVEASIVIGADGARSTVAKLVRASMYRTGRHASGVVYGLWAGMETDATEWYFARGTGAGAIPTNDGLTLVFSSAPSKRFHSDIRFDLDQGYRRILWECAPKLATRVATAQQVGSLRGFPGQVGFMRRCHGPGWALVGDAGYFKDPITAHGITDALRDAELLARAAVQGSDEALEMYAATRDTLSLPLFHITDEIAAYQWSIERVRELHTEMSREMNREVRALVAMEDETAANIMT